MQTKNMDDMFSIRGIPFHFMRSIPRASFNQFGIYWFEMDMVHMLC